MRASLVGSACSWPLPPHVRSLPPELPWFVAAVAAGALLGTWLGLDRLPRHRLLQCLGVVRTTTGVKLVS